ncbi:MAG TPA: DUF4190 domain-containing protein [Myxococcaceae bacterium]|jgi:hypothetical protein|nr:DUF4190 domain-containing protein [Myxococcaceae bacterium]
MDAPQWPESSPPPGGPLAGFQPGNPARESGLAVASLASGILCWFLLPVVGAVVAVVTGVLARRDIRASQGAVGGWTLATAGLWLGGIHLALVALAILTVVALLIAGVGLAFLWH